MNQFCIFAGARTGSSSLYEFFKDAGVRIRFEPFRPNRWTGQEFDVKVVADEIYKHSDAMKHIWDHMSVQQNQELIEFLIEKKVKIIYLTRTEKIWQALSRALAFQTNFWGNTNNSVEEKTEYQLKELHPISTSLLRDYISMSELADKVFNDLLLDADSETWVYEELFIENKDARIQNVSNLLSFLGMTTSPYIIRLIGEHLGAQNKVNTLDIYRKIPNWDVIKEVFSISEDEL